MMRRDALMETLSRNAADRGAASVTVVEGREGEPCAAWVPDSRKEPQFLIYSVTKVFTAAVLLRLCEEGAVSLHDSVGHWFPDLAHAERITVKQLLNHTAGVPDYGGLPAYHRELRQDPTAPWSLDRFAAETFGKGLLSQPGDGFSYSNPGFMLARTIAEQSSGKPYPVLIADYITGPLGMHDTFVAESLADLSSLAPGTSCQLSADGSPRDVRGLYHPGWVSHGVIASTTTDVARFLAALFHGALLSDESLTSMLELVVVRQGRAEGTHQSPLRPGTPGYGLGLMGDPESPWGLLVGHNGGGPCYSASAFHAFARGGVSVCCMAAIEDGFSTERVVAEVLDGFYG